MYTYLVEFKGVHYQKEYYFEELDTALIFCRKVFKYQSDYISDIFIYRSTDNPKIWQLISSTSIYTY